MKILVTGSRGFVGGSVGRFAAAAGHDVLGIGRSSQPEPDWPGRYVQADVLHASLADVIADFEPEIVIHGAGTASVGASLTAPLDDLRAAVLTWANTLESIRHSGVRPTILFPSSAAVYGNPATLPVSETAAVAPVSPYGFHKAACELIAREYTECFGLNIIVCRLFSLFGARQRRLLVWELFEQMSGPNETVWLQGTGQESRDYLHMEDLAALMFKLAAHPAYAESKSEFRVINLASGYETSVLGLAHQMGALLDSKKSVACRGADRPGNPVRWSADVTRLRTLLPDWQPASLGEGLTKCFETWRS